MQMLKMWKYVKKTTNWEGWKGSCFCPQGRCWQGPRRTFLHRAVNPFLSDPRVVCRNTFLPETLEKQSTGLEIAAWVTELGCEASQLLFNHKALPGHTVPLMGRREREQRRASLLKPYPTYLPWLDGLQSPLLCLFLCASIWILDCSIQISKTLKNINCALPAPSTKPLLESNTQKKKEGEKEDVCKPLQVAAHQRMQSFSFWPALPNQNKK